MNHMCECSAHFFHSNTDQVPSTMKMGLPASFNMIKILPQRRAYEVIFLLSESQVCPVDSQHSF